MTQSAPDRVWCRPVGGAALEVPLRLSPWIYDLVVNHPQNEGKKQTKRSNEVVREQLK
jgi:hypothetical protein